MATLNLSALGAELDAIRRQRAPSSSSVDTASTGTSPITPPILSTSLPLIVDSDTEEEEVDDAIRIDTPRIDTPKPEVAVAEGRKEQPFATCLLCFQRPPSAVLLPCCHLNLCYLCAPLLIARNAPSCPAARDDDPEPRTDRVPFNVALARAMRKSLEKKRLGMAGFIPPELGQSGAELGGKDLLSGPIRSQTGNDGQIKLESRGEGERGVGKTQCLVCRSGVEGWLRVYTG